LAALIAALAIEAPVVLCGLSMGGYVAFQFWRKYRQKLRALVLYDTRSAADSSDAAVGRGKMADLVARAGRSPLGDAMLPTLVSASRVRDQPQVIESLKRSILAGSPEGVIAALGGLSAREDATSWLNEIGLPTLVVVGEHDAISPVDEMRAMSGAIANSQFV